MEGQGFVVALGFENFGAHQLPLSDGDLIDQVLLSRVLGLIPVLEAVALPRVFLDPWICAHCCDAAVCLFVAM